MNLTDKINMLAKNKREQEKRKRVEALVEQYEDLKKLYNEVESSLKQGYTRIVVRGEDEKKVAKRYFSDCWVGCSGDCITNYVLEMTEKGISKLERDYIDAKEEYENVK